MLTKTLKFDDEVLEIIKSMRWEDEGRLGILPAGQLERGLYERVNKALDVMGGKWNRKLKGHVFPLDPRPQVEGLLERGSLIVERDGFFETPDSVIELMLSHVPLDSDMRVLEPSAGLGKIAGHLASIVGIDNLVCVERNAQRAAYLFEQRGYTTLCQDFLEYHPRKPFNRVYMNPPFEELQDVAHVMHAYSLLRPRGEMVSVMAEGAFFRSDKKSVAFRKWLDKNGGYSEKLPEGAFKESGTMVNARLVVIPRLSG